MAVWIGGRLGSRYVWRVQDERAPVPWKVSNSLESARRGEVLILDNDGEVMSGSATRRASVRGWLAMGSIAGGAMLLTTVVLGSPVGGALGVAVAMLAVAWRARHGADLRRALALASAGRRDEALQIVRSIDARKPPAEVRPFVDYLMAKLEWQRGEFSTAAERYTRAIAALAPTKNGRGKGMYWICMVDRVQLAAAAGQTAQAKALFADLGDAPSGAYFRLEVALANLMYAFAADDDTVLPADEELYDWAKEVLSTHRFGLNAVLLGWAFSRRGDEEMASHLLAEAPARLEVEHLADIAPAINEWFEGEGARLAAALADA